MHAPAMVELMKPACISLLDPELDLTFERRNAAMGFEEGLGRALDQLIAMARG